MVKDLQAKYLRDIITVPKSELEFIPTSFARMNKFGNIAGLRAGIKSGKFKVVKSGNKKRLIDTKKKKNRVVAVRAAKKRKQIYDFYEEGTKGMRAIVSGVRGHFTVRKL
ncbi:hypothetical protein GKQ23_12975 [Erwinia sp. E602]|nr:hypothetical protein GKQ23_12975 [Erwinia sp. E602]